MTDIQQQNTQEVQEQVNLVQLQKTFAKRANVYYMIIAMQIRIEQLTTFASMRLRPPPMVLKELQSGFQLTENFYLLRSAVNIIPFELHKQIFQQTIAVLQLLAIHDLYVKGSLLDTIVVYYNPTYDKNYVDIQLFGQIFQSTPTDSDQIEELRQELGQQQYWPINKFSSLRNIVLPIGNQLRAPLELENIATIVNRIQDINILKNEVKILLLQQVELSNEQILFYLFKNMSSYEKVTTQKCTIELWILLARFLRSRQAICNVMLIPWDLDRYVRYVDPEPLPNYIQNICGTEKILERLRIMIGVHPQEISFWNDGYCLQNLEQLHEPNKQLYEQVFKCKNCLSTEQLSVASQLPIWIYQRIQQLAFLSDPELGIKVSDEVVWDGLTISCPNTMEGYWNLLQKIIS